MWLSDTGTLLLRSPAGLCVVKRTCLSIPPPLLLSLTAGQPVWGQAAPASCLVVTPSSLAFLQAILCVRELDHASCLRHQLDDTENFERLKSATDGLVNSILRLRQLLKRRRQEPDGQSSQSWGMQGSLFRASELLFRRVSPCGVTKVLLQSADSCCSSGGRCLCQQSEVCLCTALAPACHL